VFRQTERHRDKDIEEAIVEMVGAGWRIERSRGRAAHAWGKAFCPMHGHAGHLDCATSISGTPRSGANEARRLRQRIKRCQRLSEAT